MKQGRDHRLNYSSMGNHKTWKN